MAEKCAVALEASLVQALASADDWAKFSRFSQASFVNDNPFLKWCPAAGCGKAVKASRTGGHEVSCSCGMIFCFGCSVEAHYPLSCAQLQAWDEKNKSDSETAKYIKANTKKCPKCQTPIEKNGGCNCTPRAAAASTLCVHRRPARPVPKLTSLASGRGRDKLQVRPRVLLLLLQRRPGPPQPAVQPAARFERGAEQARAREVPPLL